MPLAARPMHQHISMLNFSPFRLLMRTSRVTSSVRKNVTIGMGAFIHISNAYARVVSLGFISFIVCGFAGLQFHPAFSALYALVVVPTKFAVAKTKTAGYK